MAGLFSVNPMDANSIPPQIQKLFPADEIKNRVRLLAEDISRDYIQQELHIVGILKGSFIFLADLVRALTIPCFIHFLHASSYGNKKTSSGQVRIDHALNLHEKHILVVEDIIDTGLTINRVVRELQSQKPASLKICTLLDKPDARQFAVDVQYTGFTVPNKFVVGYGIDFSERYRKLPYIAVLKE